MDTGLVRYPANIEGIWFKAGYPYSWLTVGRNDRRLSVPLTGGDCRYLAKLLAGPGEAILKPAHATRPSDGDRPDPILVHAVSSVGFGVRACHETTASDCLGDR